MHTTSKNLHNLIAWEKQRHWKLTQVEHMIKDLCNIKYENLHSFKIVQMLRNTKTLDTKQNLVHHGFRNKACFVVCYFSLVQSCCVFSLALLILF
jgi:TnpA family transposase